MSPEDPRHGTKRGYNQGCREECCRRANMRALKQWRMGLSPKLIDPTGTRRRILSLGWLGYTYGEIAEAAGGYTKGWVREVLKQPRVTETTAAKVAAVYDRWSMKVAPTGPHRERVRALAVARGAQPPLAWDDIDDPAETPILREKATADIDEVLVQRVLSGNVCQVSAHANMAERIEIRRRWVAVGRPINDLARLTGWKPERYAREDVA